MHMEGEVEERFVVGGKISNTDVFVTIRVPLNLDEIRFNARPRDVYDAVHTMADILKEVGNAIAMNIYHHRDSLQSEAERLVLEAYGRKLPVVKTSFEMDFSVVAVVVSMSASASAMLVT